MLLLAAVVTALLAGLSVRLGLVATAIVSYLAFVAQLALITLVLSPLREVDQAELRLPRGRSSPSRSDAGGYVVCHARHSARRASP